MLPVLLLQQVSDRAEVHSCRRNGVLFCENKKMGRQKRVAFITVRLGVTLLELQFLFKGESENRQNEVVACEDSFQRLGS